MTVTLPSPYPAPELLDRLATLVTERGLVVFARIEFSRDATAAGLTLAPMAQLVFGHPRGGTPVLAAAPLAGLELPLRALAWTDADAKAWLSYADPGELQDRYALPDSAAAGLQIIHALCRDAVA
ncbi:MAG: DUF302 domain-containing protein [Gemmatimonadaceae bacterium]|nr:DUF302 domain-containing protein [Gemmatimonadaceae bacterium]